MLYAHLANNDGSPFTQALLRRAFKQTAQRKAVWDTLCRMDGHPTPEELLTEAAQKGHNLSMATVYRTLKLFWEVGIIRRLDFGDGQSRYERLDGSEPHLHLICEQCGCTLDVIDQEVTRRYRLLASRHSFDIRRQATCLYGLCANCAEKE